MLLCSACDKGEYKKQIIRSAAGRKKLAGNPMLARNMDLLMWVGASFYPTPDAFVKEAKKMGVSKRVPGFPIGIVKGQTRVFLIHKKAIEVQTAEGPKYLAGVFAHFTVRGVVHVVDAGMDLPAEFAKRGVESYEYVEGGFGANDERGCGSLDVNGTYLLSEDDMSKVAEIAQSSSMKGRIAVLKEPLPYTGKKFRGVNYVNGNKLLAAAAEDSWGEGVEEDYKYNYNAYYRFRFRVKKEQDAEAEAEKAKAAAKKKKPRKKKAK